ncbi:amino acid ABC transporter substrate-binding protein, PAAT family [Andreprevotia lacus DSM 23236]|jgi:polar amino acid transport system substrate-binding protein|uniref:Amino acid ABC transporter substrate-binding protein, PAAT family n=1 Tax=Andreprevotia lacus DSM 23236 TaxID=1121001 RepID=A0A1W1WZR8_9NEIS|nr:transporter substrate-binding domain-containing protein [Andreprevotia lacus]SMC16938.1 amino acid ABC transporter substrate-binding protein, PAAT family [Andreprevotia lacus DSM 23236]
MATRFAWALLLVGALAWGGNVLTTDEMPPYSFRDADRQMQGAAYALVTALAARIPEPPMLDIVPWARAVETTRSNPGTLMYPLARTPSRESSYSWVMPLLTDDIVLVSKPSFIADPGKPMRVGVMRGSVIQELLGPQGVMRWDESPDQSTAFRKMVAGRTDAWISTREVAEYIIRSGGGDTTQYRFSSPVARVVLYLAANPAYPAEQAKQWQAAMNAIRQDGTLAAIKARYEKGPLIVAP